MDTDASHLEVDRGFVDHDSSYDTDGDSELTSLSSSITAYVSTAVFRKLYSESSCES